MKLNPLEVGILALPTSLRLYTDVLQCNMVYVCPINLYWMKNISLKLTALFLFALIGFKSIDAQTVYTTKTGAKYHSAGCQYLRKSSFATTLKDAINSGYTACSRCNPPTTVKEDNSNNAPAKSQEYKSTAATQCTGTTQKGNRCKRMTTNSSGRCYQHWS